MSRCIRKPTIFICENKGADQLRGNREADLRLCFRYAESTIPLLLQNPKFQASSCLLWLNSPVCVGPGRKPKLLVFSCTGSNKNRRAKSDTRLERNRQHRFVSVSIAIHYMKYNALIICNHALRPPTPRLLFILRPFLLI